MLKKYSLGYYKKIGTAIYLKLNYFTYNLFKKEKKFLMKNEYRAAEKPLFEINNYLIYRKKKKEKHIKISWNFSCFSHLWNVLHDDLIYLKFKLIHEHWITYKKRLQKSEKNEQIFSDKLRSKRISSYLKNIYYKTQIFFLILIINCYSFLVFCSNFILSLT